MIPYYEDESVTLFLGDARDAYLEPGAVVVTDPPYPNGAGHFLDGIEATEQFCRSYVAERWFVFWHQLSRPPVPMDLVAHHIWYKTNTNRPDNYEPVYEFASGESERPSRVFAHAVIYPGLTGCVEATGHPTQKPVALMRSILQLRPIRSVIDPFAGSGTTLRAAKDLGIRAIGFEIDERFCAMAAGRLAQESLMFDVPRFEQGAMPL